MITCQLLNSDNCIADGTSIFYTLSRQLEPSYILQFCYTVCTHFQSFLHKTDE